MGVLLVIPRVVLLVSIVLSLCVSPVCSCVGLGVRLLGVVDLFSDRVWCYRILVLCPWLIT